MAVMKALRMKATLADVGHLTSEGCYKRASLLLEYHLLPLAERMFGCNSPICCTILLQNGRVLQYAKGQYARQDYLARRPTNVHDCCPNQLPFTFSMK